MDKQQVLSSPKTLSVSCVIYDTPYQILEPTIGSLAKAVQHAKLKRPLISIELHLIDNNNNHNGELLSKIATQFGYVFNKVICHAGHGNIGYGRGHNVALLKTQSEYHLVLNPDVLLNIENITLAITFMEAHPNVGLLAPDAFDEFGERQYLAKRKPSLLVLLARAIPVGFMRKLMAQQLYRYEYRDIIPAEAPMEIELASGCYMFLRTSTAQQIGGFDPDFFMYFEDFDLSRRIATVSRVVHHPELHIIHYGGSAFKKGIKHIKYFSGSFIKFKCKSPF